MRESYVIHNDPWISSLDHPITGEKILYEIQEKRSSLERKIEEPINKKIVGFLRENHEAYIGTIEQEVGGDRLKTNKKISELTDLGIIESRYRTTKNGIQGAFYSMTDKGKKVLEGSLPAIKIFGKTSPAMYRAIGIVDPKGARQLNLMKELVNKEDIDLLGSKDFQRVEEETEVKVYSVTPVNIIDKEERKRTRKIVLNELGLEEKLGNEGYVIDFWDEVNKNKEKVEEFRLGRNSNRYF